MQAKLTKATVTAVEKDPARDVWVWDTEVKGFGLRVRPNGRKVYVVEYRPGAGGRAAPKRRYTIGTHGSPWTADAARDEAQRILGLTKGDRDPVAERAQARQRGGDTVKEAVEDFIEKYAKKKQRSWQETERTFCKNVYPVLGKKRLTDVTRSDIVSLIDGVARRAPIGANRTLAAVRKFFNWCVERGAVESNPCSGLKPPGKETERERVLTDSELAELWHAIGDMTALWQPFLKTLILTGQRRNEVAAMQWSHVDLQKGMWTIPQANAKNNTGHEVPLCATVVEALKTVPRVQIEVNGRKQPSPYVFTTTGRTPISGFSKAKAEWDIKVLERRQKAARERHEDPEAVEGIQDWIFHDLRRTLTTGIAGMGIPPQVADAILNHKEGTIRGVAKVYNRYAYLDERRRALESWEVRVLALVAGHGTSNILPFDVSKARAAGK